MRFVVAIHKDPDSSYGVTVPDLPGCISSGDTLDEAFDQAREAIKGHIETLLMTSQPVPKMRPLQEHQAPGGLSGRPVLGVCRRGFSVHPLPGSESEHHASVGIIIDH